MGNIIAVSFMALSLLFKAFPKTYRVWSDKTPNLIGAAIAFYVVFSFGPLVVLTLQIIRLFLGGEVAISQILVELEGIVSEDIIQVVEEIIDQALHRGGGSVTTIVSIPLVLLGSSMVFLQIRSALNYVWGTSDTTNGGLTGMAKSYGFGFLTLLAMEGVIFLLVIKSSVMVLVSILLSRYLPIGGGWIQAADLAINTLALMAGFTMLYRVLPQKKVPWRDAAIGAVLTSFLLLIAQIIVGLYVSKTDIGSAYGAIGSFTIFVLWVFYSSHAFLFGAVYTHVHYRMRTER